MTKIYLIRHAEAEGNFYRRAQGHYDAPLTDRGLKQAAALGERFREIPLDAVYASDLRRARRTAQAVADVRGLTVQTEPDLREMGLGIWEDLPWGNLMEDYAEQYELFSTDTDLWEIEGAETNAAVRERMMAALKRLAERHEGQTIAAVSHGMALRGLFSVLPDHTGETKVPAHSENTAVSVVHAEDGELRLVSHNDFEHLPPELRTVTWQTWWRDPGGRDLSSLIFRPLDLRKDGQLYMDCYADAWRFAHGSLQGFDAEVYLKDAQRRTAPETLMAAYSGDTFAGIINLEEDQPLAEGAGWISFCYVVPELRRKHFGLQLIGHAISWFRRQGKTALRLCVSEDNTAAQRFYKACGFHETGRRKGVVVPLIIMEKEL